MAKKWSCRERSRRHLTDDLFERAKRCERSIFVIPLPPRKSGRRARRQAFYQRKRIERTLDAILRDSIKVHGELIHEAVLSCTTTGLGWVEVRRKQDPAFFPFEPLEGREVKPGDVLWDRGDGEGFTARPIEPGEWPRAMLRTRSIEP